MIILWMYAPLLMLDQANVLKTVNSVLNPHTTTQAFRSILSWMKKAFSKQHVKLKEAGAIRFSIVTSGRNTNNPDEFDQIIHVLGRIKNEIGLEICCSLGLLTYEQALKLKEVGVTRYHSNIETAPSHFPDICTTHSYEDKMFTIDNAQKAGIRVCSGGILGLNETLEQRVEMAFELKRLHIDSVPLNILNPVKGTPFESNEALRPLDILRTFAVFRFILPNALIRTAGGRRNKSYGTYNLML